MGMPQYLSIDFPVPFPSSYAKVDTAGYSSMKPFLSFHEVSHVFTNRTGIGIDKIGKGEFKKKTTHGRTTPASQPNPNQTHPCNHVRIKTLQAFTFSKKKNNGRTEQQEKPSRSNGAMVIESRHQRGASHWYPNPNRAHGRELRPKLQPQKQKSPPSMSRARFGMLDCRKHRIRTYCKRIVNKTGNPHRKMFVPRRHFG